MIQVKAKIKELKEYLCCRERLIPLLVGMGVCLFAWFAAFGDQGLYQLHRSKVMKQEMNKDISRLTKKIDRLKKERELLRDPSRLESIIREELGYVKPGEVVFQPINQ